MLAIRRCESALGHRAQSRHTTVSQTLRMSNFEALTTQLDWRDQYSSFTPPPSASLPPPTFGQPMNQGSETTRRLSSGSAVVIPALEQHVHIVGSQVHPATDLTSTIQPELDICGHGLHDVVMGQQDIVRSELQTATHSTAVSDRLTGSDSGRMSEDPPVQLTSETIKEESRASEEADYDEDESMVDVEEDEIEGRPMTAAERTAEKKKQRRHRYRLFPGSDRRCSANDGQSYASADALSHERVRQTTAPRRRAPGKAFAANPGNECASSTGLVSEQVCTTASRNENAHQR